MAPGYRTGAQSSRTSRANRTNVANHDIFEGIPVRQWRRDYVTVAPHASTENNNAQNDIWAIELPHGMPKDYHELPQHSQDLLRAARSGRIYKRPAAEEEEVEAELSTEKTDKKDEELKENGFTAKAWKQVNRDAPSIEYLAKRRKGVITAGTKPVTIPTVTKATVRRVDATGNAYVQDLVVANGAKIEGEVLSQTLIPDPSIVPVQPSPIRRKGKGKKKSGPGRGKKKILTTIPTSVPDAGVAKATENSEQNGIKTELEDTPMSGTVNEDTEMGGNSNAASDDEGDDGDDGDEGDEGDEDDEGTPEVQDSPSRTQSNDSPIPDGHTTLSHVDPDTTMTDSPLLERLKSDVVKSGSPLKNVALSTSNVNSPLPSPSIPAPTESTSNVESDEAIASTEVVPEAEIEVKLPSPPVAVIDNDPLPSPPPNPTETIVEVSKEEIREEEEEEEMLLDVYDTATSKQSIDVSTEADQAKMEEITPTVEESASIEVSKPVEESKIVEESKPTEEGLNDLLGTLEKSLDA